MSPPLRGSRLSAAHAVITGRPARRADSRTHVPDTADILAFFSAHFCQQPSADATKGQAGPGLLALLILNKAVPEVGHELQCLRASATSDGDYGSRGPTGLCVTGEVTYSETRSSAPALTRFLMKITGIDLHVLL